MKNPISQRLLNQELICPQFNSTHDVVSWMGAMQTQEYKMMLYDVEEKGMLTASKCRRKNWCCRLKSIRSPGSNSAMAVW
jgi:hypothetical protein